MFTWSHENIVELNLPLEKVWAFFAKPSNWPKWIDKFESCDSPDPLKAGSIVKVKIKNRNMRISILISELKPYSECKICIKVPFFLQESSSILQEISRDRTLLVLKTSVRSFLTPFFKFYFLKNVESQYEKCIKVIYDSISDQSL